MTDETSAPDPEEVPGQGSDDLGVQVPDDISGIDNFIEEGNPLEPEDVAEVEGAPVDPLAAAQQEAAERTADLQRLQAEFLNYKRRVDRDRDLVKENAVFAVLTPMLDVLDNIDRAREAGELEGGFKRVAEQLEQARTALAAARAVGMRAASAPDVAAAIAGLAAADPGCRMLICGSLYLAGHVLRENG